MARRGAARSNRLQPLRTGVRIKPDPEPAPFGYGVLSQSMRYWGGDYPGRNLSLDAIHFFLVKRSVREVDKNIIRKMPLIEATG